MVARNSASLHWSLTANGRDGCTLPAKRTISDLFAASRDRESITNVAPRRAAGFMVR
jgi:hypothetical protein